MPPQNASIFLAEDDKGKISEIRGILEGSGHQIEKEVYDKYSALTFAKRIGKTAINVALVDSNLGFEWIDGRDGREILAEIKKQNPKIKTIGISRIDHLKTANVEIVSDFKDLPAIIENL